VTKDSHRALTPDEALNMIRTVNPRADASFGLTFQCIPRAGTFTGQTHEDRRTLPLRPDHLEAEVDPTALTICHCTDCQTLTGSAFRTNIPEPAEHFVLRSGTPKSYVKTAESGNKRRHAFCGDCGTPIYACAVDNPQTYALRVGTITQRAAFSPRGQIWQRSALDWVDALAAVPATERG
jgi:hypothetical protein